MELRDHQEAALMKLSNGKILWGGVGTGKSFTAVKYYERKEAPRDVYVITTAKKRDSHDWEREFSHIGVGTEQTVHGRLTIDSWNNLQKYINTTGAFFIFDEQRLVGSGAWVKAFIKLARRNHWILLSATPGDTWMDYVPVFVANGFYANRTEFKREHVVYNTFAKFPKIDRYVGVGKLARYRQHVLIEMPFVRETLRNIIDVDVPYDAELLGRVTKDRWNVYEDRPLKDIGELYRVARKVVNSDPRRLAKVAELVSRHPKVIIFYNFDYELEMLRTLCDSPCPTRSSPESTLLVGSQQRSGSPVSPTALTRIALSEPNGPHQRSEKWICKSSSTSTSIVGDTGPWSTSQEEPSSLAIAELTAQRQRSPEEGKWTDLTSLSRSTSRDPLSNGYASTTTAEDNPSWSVPFSTAPVEVRSSTSSMPTGARTQTSSLSGVAIAEWNGHKHQRIPLEHDRWIYLVQYTAGAEGWNCTETDTMIFFSWNYSYKIWHQAQGRIDRLNTPYRILTYYSLTGKSWIDLAIRKSLRSKRDFNEKMVHIGQ